MVCSDISRKCQNKRIIHITFKAIAITLYYLYQETFQEIK